MAHLKSATVHISRGYTYCLMEYGSGSVLFYERPGDCAHCYRSGTGKAPKEAFVPNNKFNRPRAVSLQHSGPRSLAKGKRHTESRSTQSRCFENLVLQYRHSLPW